MENDEDLQLYPELSKTQNNTNVEHIRNFSDHPYTLKKGTHLAKTSILTLGRMKHITPVNTDSVRYRLNNNHDDAILYINSLLKTSETVEVNKTSWLATSENLSNEREHTPNQTPILNGLRQLEKLKQ